METQLLSTLLVSACLVFLYQVSLLYCGNLRKKHAARPYRLELPT